MGPSPPESAWESGSSITTGTRPSDAGEVGRDPGTRMAGYQRRDTGSRRDSGCRSFLTPRAGVVVLSLAVVGRNGHAIPGMLPA